MKIDIQENEPKKQSNAAILKPDKKLQTKINQKIAKNTTYSKEKYTRTFLTFLTSMPQTQEHPSIWKKYFYSLNHILILAQW